MAYLKSYDALNYIHLTIGSWVLSHYVWVELEHILQSFGSEFAQVRWAVAACHTNPLLLTYLPSELPQLRF